MASSSVPILGKADRRSGLAGCHRRDTGTGEGAVNMRIKNIFKHREDAWWHPVLGVDHAYENYWSKGEV